MAVIAAGVDKGLAHDQLMMLKNALRDLGMATFCHLFVRILAKKELYAGVGSRLVPFRLSKIQKDLVKTAADRNITLKPRQIGSTTWHIICRLFIPTITQPGTTGVLISQTKPYGAQHFRIFQRALNTFGQVPAQLMSLIDPKLLNELARMHDHLLHTQYSARHEILFDFLDSKVLVETAENPDAGTGLTINRLVATEVAYWSRDPESLLAQAKEAIPKGGTMDLESTPNGMGGYFFEEWMRSGDPNAEFSRHFYPWWWQEEYEDEKKADRLTIDEKEVKFIKEFGWTLKQLQWRRGKVVSLRKKFPEKYPEDSTTCFLTSGDLFMDKELLREIKIRLTNYRPLETYHNGQYKIYKKRIPGRRYIMGVDVAEGKLVATDNPDETVGIVMDIDSGEWVAQYRSQLPEEEAAVDIVDIAQQYNNAELAIERNGPGGTMLVAVRSQLLYGNIYQHRDWHKQQAKALFFPGFPTNVRTRPMACNRIKAAVRERPEFIHSEDFVDQALTFVWRTTSKQNQFGKRVPQGAQGCKDDIVMAAAIGEYARLVKLGYLDPVEAPSEHYGQEFETEEDAA